MGCLYFCRKKPTEGFLSVVVITCASHAQGRRFDPGRKQNFVPIYYVTSSLIETILLAKHLRFHGVMVSTLDFESSDPSSNLGGTLSQLTPWRNGSASDSRSEGCVFESRRGHTTFWHLFVRQSKNILPPMRIELMTFGLQDQRSATEL